MISLLFLTILIEINFIKSAIIPDAGFASYPLYTGILYFEIKKNSINIEYTKTDCLSTDDWAPDPNG
jgi:hypothetical protein